MAPHCLITEATALSSAQVGPLWCSKLHQRPTPGSCGLSAWCPLCFCVFPFELTTHWAPPAPAALGHLPWLPSTLVSQVCICSLHKYPLLRATPGWLRYSRCWGSRRPGGWKFLAWECLNTSRYPAPRLGLCPPKAACVLRLSGRGTRHCVNSCLDTRCI